MRLRELLVHLVIPVPFPGSRTLKVVQAKTRVSAIQDNASAGPRLWAWALGGPWAWPLGLGLGLWPWAMAVGLSPGPGLVARLWRCGMRVQKK